MTSSGRRMIFPPSWSGDQYTAAEEAEHEAEQRRAEEEADSAFVAEQLRAERAAVDVELGEAA